MRGFMRDLLESQLNKSEDRKLILMWNQLYEPIPLVSAAAAVTQRKCLAFQIVLLGTSWHCKHRDPNRKLSQRYRGFSHLHAVFVRYAHQPTETILHADMFVGHRQMTRKRITEWTQCFPVQKKLQSKLFSVSYWPPSKKTADGKLRWLIWGRILKNIVSDCLIGLISTYSQQYANQQLPIENECELLRMEKLPSGQSPHVHAPLPKPLLGRTFLHSPSLSLRLARTKGDKQNSHSRSVEERGAKRGAALGWNGLWRSRCIWSFWSIIVFHEGFRTDPLSCSAVFWYDLNTARRKE